ncbi:uncharacterized protein PV09_06603 [Verruconis gallopava]|uniref:Uncharacterized protein n=1 Tax=Verruconis gallopava TaxID=253628 RepID=A0A0D1YMY8_9PEZI|nr:uncharacterized protein PV09_06603 [Verruconis gallopava]KIW02112.1 hypothetical protein PV09_06603 [Verruconis gallopava]
MAVTRSANKQTHLGGVPEQKSKTRSQSKQKHEGDKSKRKRTLGTSGDGGMLSPPPSPTRKRKLPPIEVQNKTKKVAKREAESEEAGQHPQKAIIINRAPVLHLWAASVTHFLHPELDWSTCLSAGKAISTICAVAKGRSIGAIDEPEDTAERKRRKDEQKKKEAELDVLEIMQFKLKHKDGKVYFGGKPQSDSEGALKIKFGDGYEDVRRAFDEGLRSWKGHEGELNKAAFTMYENFRPRVSKGQRGWGKSGKLDLDTVSKTISMGLSCDGSFFFFPFCSPSTIQIHTSFIR